MNADLQEEIVEPVDLDHVHRLAALPVANIGDAMDRLNVVAAGISPVWKGARLAGPAFTVDVVAGDNAGIHEALDSVRPGEVVVVNGHGHLDRALIGELIAERLLRRGAVGFVVDGAVRDVDELEELRFPVFARAVTPAGPYRNGPWRIGAAVAIGGVVVHPGDVVVGDGDGVAVVPRGSVEQVLTRARAKHDAESAQREEIRSREGAR